MSLDRFSQLPPLPIEDHSVKRELPCRNNLGEADELQNDKMECISRLLKEIMQDTLTNAKESSTHLSILRDIACSETSLVFLGKNSMKRRRV